MKNQQSGTLSKFKLFMWIGGGIALLISVVLTLARRGKILPLRPALESVRDTFMSKSAGVLSYYKDKSGNGRPLILIHSINASGSAFEMKPLFEYYRGKRPVYALDLPGYGFSDRGNRDYLPQLYSSAIQEFVENQVKEEADVIVLSLSSEFVARAASQSPHLFSSLVFISPTGFNEEIIELPTDTLYKIFNFPLWRGALFNLLTARFTIRYYCGLSFAGDCAEEFSDYAYLTAHQPEAANAPLYFLSGKMFTPTIRTDIYEKVKVPVLVIYDEDPNVKFDTLNDHITRNASWQAVRVAPSSGLPHWEILEETVVTLQEFWCIVSI